MSPRTAIQAMRNAPWTALVAVIFGVSIAPGGGFDWAYALYDDVSPVVSMRGKIVDRGPDQVVLHIEGEKHRHCQYITIRGYALRDNLLHDANIERVDRPMDGHTKPPGSYSIGLWRVWPVAQATAVKVFVKHSCDGRLVTTEVADVDLQQ